MPEPGETGVVKSIGRIEDEDGKTVLQAIVHFYDGNCPALTFGTVWGRVPVKIIEEQALTTATQDKRE